MSVLADARKAVQDVLTSGLDIPVHAHPPQEFNPPFVTIDRSILTPDDLLAMHQSRVRITLSVWSNARGARQVEEYLDQIYTLLHDIDLTSATGHPVMCKCEFLDAVRDQDGVTYVGSAIFAVTIGH